MRKLKIFIDGSCANVFNKEKAIGGWGFIITNESLNIIHKDYGKLRPGNQNSTRAELEALNKSLIAIKKYSRKNKFDIYCDNETVVNGVNGFNQRKANRDIWEDIEPLCILLSDRVKIHHIKGHKDYCALNLMHNKVDELAKAGANSLLK